MIFLSSFIPSISFAGKEPSAQQKIEKTGVTAKISTLGFGGDITIRLMPRFNARLGGNLFRFNIEPEGDDEDDEIQVELTLQTIGGVVDWHPWSSGFRLSFGVMLNNNKLALSATSGDAMSVSINEVEYSLQSLDSQVTFNVLAPYLGLGYGDATSRKGHWHFACDLGFLFQGRPHAELDAVATNLVLQPFLDEDLEAQTREIEDYGRVFMVYPVLSFGISYAF